MKDFIDYVMNGDKQDELAKTKAELSYTLNCLEREIAIANQAEERLVVARKALQFIADGYENNDINHVDYRVKVYQVATETLEEIAIANQAEERLSTARKALEEAALQLEYVQEKHGYATGETVLARVRAALDATK